MPPKEKVNFIKNWIKSYVEKMPNPAKSLALALPAIIVSAVPINKYDIWDPKIGKPITVNFLNSFKYFFN